MPALTVAVLKRRTTRRVIKFAASAVTLGLTAVGCSRVTLAYDWADWLIERQVSRYLDLDPVQETRAEEAIDGWLAWHRRTLLPDYARLLRDTADLHDQGRFDRASFEATYARVDQLYRQTVRSSLPGITGVLATQRPAQVDSLAKRLDERQVELVQQLARPQAEQVAERIDGFADALEGFLGPLTEAQQTLLEERLQKSFGGGDLWLKNRRARSDELLTALRRGAQPAQIESVLRRWWLGEDHDPTYARASDAFVAELKNLLFDILAQVTPQQRAHLVGTLRSYAKDFDTLTKS